MSPFALGFFIGLGGVYALFIIGLAIFLYIEDRKNR